MKFAHKRGANEAGVCRLRVLPAGLDVWNRCYVYHTMDKTSLVVVIGVVVGGGCYQ